MKHKCVVPFITLLSCLLMASAPAREIAFTKHIIDGDFDEAMSVCAADLDGDGDADVLGAAMAVDEVAWWENDGHANFTKHVIDGHFDGAISVFAADMDHDGDLDVLAAAEYQDTIAWYENDGSGNLTRHVIDSAFDGAVSVYATDVDGDNDMDVVGAAWLANEVAWWENDGSCHFVKHVIDTSFSAARCVYATDLDGDGDTDILGAAYYGHAIAWYENDSNASFTRHLIDSGLVGARSVYAADVDSDGDIDVLGAADDGGDVAWYENDGHRNFTKHLIDGNFNGAWSVLAMDIDGDTDVDVVAAAKFAPDIAWWENDGTQHFTRHDIGGNFQGAHSVCVEDLDNDGDKDILGAATDIYDIAWFENYSTEDVSISLTTTSGGPLPSPIIVNSLADGYEEDVVVVHVTGHADYPCYLEVIESVAEDTYAPAVRVCYDEYKTRQKIRAASFTKEYRIPALPVLNNSGGMHTVSVGLFRDERKVAGQTASYSVTVENPDMVAVTNPEKLRQYFNLSDFQDYSTGSSPCVLQLLQNVARDDAILLYTESLSDLEIAERIRETADTYFIAYVFIVGNPAIVPASESPSGTGIGDHLYWAETFGYSRLPTLELSPERDECWDGPIRETNYLLYRRLLTTAGTSPELDLSGGSGLFFGCYDAPPLFSFHTNALANESLALSYLSQTRHHLDNGYASSRDSYEFSFLRSIDLLYAVGHGCPLGVGGLDFPPRDIRWWHDRDGEQEWPCMLFHRSAESGTDPLSLHYWGIAPKSFHGLNWDLDYQPFSNRPLAFFAACSTCRPIVCGSLGDMFLSVGGESCAGFGDDTTVIANGVIADAYLRLVGSSGEGRRLGDIHLATEQTALYSPWGLLPFFQVHNARMTLIQYGYPKRIIRTASPGPGIFLGLTPQPRSWGTTVDPAPPLVTVDVESYRTNTIDGGEVISFSADVNGVSTDSTTWTLQGNPVLPYIHRVYDLGPSRLSDLSVSYTSSSLNQHELYVLPASTFGSLYEYYPLGLDVYFDEPVKWTTRKTSEGSFHLILDVFPFQWTSSTLELVLCDDIDIAITTTTAQATIDDASLDRAYYMAGESAQLTVASSGANEIRVVLDGETSFTQVATGSNTFTISGSYLTAGHHSLDVNAYVAGSLHDQTQTWLFVYDHLLDFRGLVVSETVAKTEPIRCYYHLINENTTTETVTLGGRVFSEDRLTTFSLGSFTIGPGQDVYRTDQLSGAVVPAGLVSVQLVAEVGGKEFRSALETVQVTDPEEYMNSASQGHWLLY